MIYEFFPEGYIALNKELASGFHPTLAAKLSKHKADDIDVKIGEIAAHCGVQLDGTFTLEERSDLCQLLATMLYDLRESPSPIILLS